MLAVRKDWDKTLSAPMLKRWHGELLRGGDGREGIQAGLSAAKWMRMAKVSKRTAERDLADLAKAEAVFAVDNGPQTRYQLAFDYRGAIDVAIDDPIKDPIKKKVLEFISSSPGVNRIELAQKTGRSVETVKRAVAALAKAGRVERRGSKKTGGYYAK